MKRNILLSLIVGAAAIFGIICSAIILVQGIRMGTFKVPSAAREERYPNAWELEKTKLEEFSDISISLSYCNLSVLPADGYYLEYRMDGTCEEPQYNVSDGSFCFQEGHTQTKYRSGFHLFFNSGSFSSYNQGPYYVKLYVPQTQYFNLLSISDNSGDIEIDSLQAKNAEIKADYGNLNLDSFSGEELNISTDSGNIELGTITCDNLDLSNEYGNIEADSFQIAKSASITLDSGSLELSSLTSGNLTLSNEYGNCTIDEITVAASSISLDSGKLILRHAALGNTEINNEYGDTDISLTDNVADYNYNLHADYGTIKLDGTTLNSNDDGEVHYQKDNGKKNDIRIFCESGNIDIR